MEEVEASTEMLEEDIHHRVHESRERWISSSALSSAIFAVFAAISALISNHHANEAMIQQIQASDHWGYFQAKGIKASVLGTKIELLTALRKKISKKDREKLIQYKQEQDDLSEKAHEKESLSEKHLNHHLILARSVTLFQVAIALAAISILTKKKRFWSVSLGVAVVGLSFLVQGLFFSQ